MTCFNDTNIRTGQHMPLNQGTESKALWANNWSHDIHSDFNFSLLWLKYFYSWLIFIRCHPIIVSKEFETEAYFLYLGDNIFFLLLVFLKNMFCKRWKRTQILLVFPFIIIAFFREGRGHYWFYKLEHVYPETKNKEF